MTPANRIEITLSDDKLASLDAARQHEPRASFIKRAIDAQVRAALSSSETPEEALNRIAQSSPEELGMSRSQARMNAVQRGSASPSLERFSKAQRKGGKA